MENGGSNSRAADSGRVFAPAQPQTAQHMGVKPTADQTRDRIIEVLKTIYDPEIPVDIYELGLFYDIDVSDDGAVAIRMTLTTPMCAVADRLPREVEVKLRAVPGVSSVQLDLVWDPPWTMDRMSEAARLQLNL